MNELNEFQITAIQQVELNRVGWYNFLVQRLILAEFWAQGTTDHLTKEEIIEKIRTDFGIDVTNDFSDHMHRLTVNGQVFKVKHNQYKITEECKNRFNQSTEEAKLVINRAQILFLESINGIENYEPQTKTEIWNSLIEDFIKPYVSRVGAKFFELITKQKTLQENDILDKYVNKFPSEHQESIRTATVNFVTSQDNTVKSFLLRYLHAYFFVQASGLSPKHLRNLQNLPQGKKFNLLLDTNFLFSILDLHENASNVSANALLELINSPDCKVEVSLYVSDETINEFNRAIQNTISSLRVRPYPAQISYVAKKYLTGLARKYFDIVNKSEHEISPKDFFQPYLHNLRTLLEEKNISILTDSLEPMKLDPKVIDDIVEQNTREEKSKDPKPKGYYALEHDIALWHYVNNKRPFLADSPLEIEDWIVTIDFGFLGFDNYKITKDYKEAFPICLHPSTLIQLLQLWIPRTDILEESFLSSLWLPVAMEEFDAQAEQVTLKILQTINSFENRDELDIETIEKIVTNDLVRSRIQNTKSIEEEIVVVKEAIIRENSEILKAFEQTKSHQNDLEKQIARLLEQNKKTEKELKRLRENLTKILFVSLTTICLTIVSYLCVKFIPRIPDINPIIKWALHIFFPALVISSSHCIGKKFSLIRKWKFLGWISTLSSFFYTIILELLVAYFTKDH